MKKLNSLAVIYASEGTGHKTAAFALCEAFLAYNPQGRLLCLDILDIIPPWLKYAVSEGYAAMARRAPWLWGAFYWGSDRPGAQSRAFEWTHEKLCRLYLPRLDRLFAANGTEAALFTHYFGAAELARAQSGLMPVCCVDTDFECHSFQLSADFAWSFAGSERAVSRRASRGIYNVSDSGVPIARKYKKLPAKEEARARLGLPRDERVILVSGGGLGAGALFAAAKSLAAIRGLRVVVVCGGNHRLLWQMEGYFRFKENVRVKGFVPDMENYYAAADAAVMKPGGLSVSEALCAGLPMLLIDPIPGQEELNMAYLTSKGAAWHIPRPSKAAEAAAALFSGGAAQEMSEAAKELARPEAADEIIAKTAEII
ncbi:MAG: glycosyltransferase [Synergistaceae bacterium]|nr:glycosyltransferase [Synergistaceae bacterium]